MAGDGKLTLTGANIVFFAFSILYIVFQFILGVLAAIFGEGFLDDNIYGILLINQYIVILVPVAVYTLVKRLDVRSVFRIKSLKLLPAALIILMSVPAQLVGNMLNSFIIYPLQFIGKIPSNPIPVPRSLWELILGIAVVAVSPAICEELLHRGIMLTAYEKRGSLKAVAATSIFFGLFHFDITNLLGVIFLGFIIGYFVVKTDSILAGMLAHFLNNLIYELATFFSTEQAPQEKFIEMTPDEFYSCIVYGIAALAAMAVLLAVFNRLTEGVYAYKPPISNIKSDIISVVSHWPVAIIILLYLLMAALSLFSIFMYGFQGF